MSDRRWKHVGGGCFVDPKDAPDPMYPCDDQYEDNAGNWAYFETTASAHYAMPGRDGESKHALEEIQALPGVKFVKVESIADSVRRTLN